jgi:site-specific recombinase XerD
MKREKKKFLTPSEIEAFLGAAKTTRNGARDHCLALMAYRHGLRVTELISIELSDLDLNTGRIFVRRVKGSLSTSQPIEGDELRAIKRWLRERSAHEMAASSLLFLSERGPMTRQAVNYLVEIIGQKAGLSLKVNPHMLRHSCGFALAEKNTATRTIQDYLGHKNIRHTVAYTATNAERFKGLWKK